MILFEPFRANFSIFIFLKFKFEYRQARIYHKIYISQRLKCTYFRISRGMLQDVFMISAQFESEDPESDYSEEESEEQIDLASLSEKERDRYEEQQRLRLARMSKRIAEREQIKMARKAENLERREEEKIARMEERIEIQSQQR